MLAKLRKSSNIVSMKSAWADKNNLYLLLDYAINGDLTTFIKNHGPLSKEVALHYSAQLLSILNFLRIERISHRDIKPANLLLDENWNMVLTDFGSAKKRNSSNISSHSMVSGTSGVSGLSELSYISGTESNISALSGIS